MLVLESPDGLQVRPSALAYTPWSVPATTTLSPNPKTRTERPASPFTGPHDTPPSLLARAPAPRKPASTKPDLRGLNAMLRMGTPPPRATLHVEPPSALLMSAPSDLPVIK